MDFSLIAIILKLPLILGSVILAFGYLQLWRLRKSSTPQSVYIFWTWLMGLIAALVGFMGQLISMKMAFDNIAKENNITPEAVGSALRDSYDSSIMGLTVLIISLAVWGILNMVKKNHIRKVEAKNEESDLMFVE